MPGIDDLSPSATQIRKESALKEAEKAEEYARLAAAAEAEKRALIERLTKPSGKTEDEKIKLASTIIQRAVRNGLNRGSGLSLSQHAVHRQGPRHQPDGKGLGEHPDRDSEGNLPALD